MITQYEAHPFAEYMGLGCDPSLYLNIKHDINRHGQQEPILLLDGKIIDGRIRYQICQELDVEPIVRHVTGDPRHIYLSCNVFRQNLTPSQMRMIFSKRDRQKKVPAVKPPTPDEIFGIGYMVGYQRRLEDILK